MALHDFIASYVVSTGDGDRCGLHELVGAIASRRSEVAIDDVLTACQQACASLASAGHVRVEMTPPRADRPERDGYTLVSVQDALAAFEDDATWQAPSDARPRYWLIATDEGRAAYISEEVVSL